MENSRSPLRTNSPSLEVDALELPRDLGFDRDHGVGLHVPDHLDIEGDIALRHRGDGDRDGHVALFPGCLGAGAAVRAACSRGGQRHRRERNCGPPPHTPRHAHFLNRRRTAGGKLPYRKYSTSGRIFPLASAQGPHSIL